MPSVMPHFKFGFTDVAGARALCIESDGRILCEVLNPIEFYQVFGYRADPAQPMDLLPDEFLWAEYVNNPVADFSACLQIHLIEYLKKYSESFMERYGNRCDQWIADHANLRAKRGLSYIACRLNPEKNL